MRALVVAVMLSACSKEPVATQDAAPAPASSVAPQPSATVVAPSASASSAPMTAAMVVCKKLDAAGVAPDCRTGNSATTARFGQEGSPLSGVVSVFEDKKTFDTISTMLAKEQGKKLATSAKTLTVVAWESDSADIEKKIRATVSAL